jgi:hypothetical protein
MITDARANAMLDTEYVTGDLLSLHTAFSTTGTNELAGGSYARQPITGRQQQQERKPVLALLTSLYLPVRPLPGWVYGMLLVRCLRA